MDLDLEQIKELMNELKSSELTRLVLKSGAFELELERGGHELGAFAPPPPPRAELPHHPPIEPAPPPSTAQGGHVEEAESDFVSSPMVGTFYRAPSPEDLPFVKAGDSVEEETVVCIIEAMKVMNEVKAGIRGVVKKVLVENGQPVEFGSRLFEIVSG